MLYSGIQYEVDLIDEYFYRYFMHMSIQSHLIIARPFAHKVCISGAGRLKTANPWINRQKNKTMFLLVIRIWIYFENMIQHGVELPAPEIFGCG